MLLVSSKNKFKGSRASLALAQPQTTTSNPQLRVPLPSRKSVHLQPRASMWSKEELVFRKQTRNTERLSWANSHQDRGLEGQGGEWEWERVGAQAGRMGEGRKPT